MAANLNKNPETSKYLGTFFVKKTKSRITTIGTRSRSVINVRHSFLSLNHDFDTFINIYTLMGRVNTLAIQVVPSVIVIRSL